MIDSSIYLKQQAPDIVGSVEKGLSLGQMIKDRRKEADIEKAYQAGMITSPDGSVSFDEKATLGAIANKGYAKEYMQAKSQFDQVKSAQAEKQRQDAKLKIETIANVLGGVRDPMSYEAAKSRLLQIPGVTPKDLPEVYDPNQIAAITNQVLTVKDQMDLKNKEREFGMKERELALKGQENQLKRAELGQQKYLELETPYGLAKTKQDAKTIKDADEEKKNFDMKIEELISLRQKHGGEVMNREAVARGKQLSKDLLLSYKNMAKLGVLSKSDEDIINAIIPPDPLQFRSPLAAAQGQDPILNNLQKFKQDSDADFENKLKNRIRGYSELSGKPSDKTKSFSSDVLDYAKKNNITPEQAQAIKDQRTGKAAKN